MTILVCGHRLNEMAAALSYPQLKFLAAELVQQGFIFKEAASPLLFNQYQDRFSPPYTRFIVTSPALWPPI